MIPHQETLKLSDKHIHLIVWTLLFLVPLSGMAIDLIAPSLPAISLGLHVSTNMAKDVVSIYLLGCALGNFISGFLADAYGRQKLLRYSLLAFMVVSALPLFFPNIIIVLVSRFLQGITLGSVSVVGRTVFSDVLPPEKLIRLGTISGTMFGLGPVIGPVIGGYLQYFFGWQAGFCFFSIAAALGLIAVFFIVPETHFARHPLNIKTIKTNLGEVLTHTKFMGIVVLMGVAYSLIVAFNTAGPFLIQSELGFSPVFFGHFALGLGVVYLLATFVCRYLLRFYEVEELYFTLTNVFFCLAGIAVIASYVHEKSIILVALSSALMYFTCGFIFPMSIGKGMSLFRHIAGTATATMFLFNMSITSLMGFLVSFVEVKNTISLMWIYFGLFSIAMVVYWRFVRVEPFIKD